MLLPNLDCVQEAIETFADALRGPYIINYLEDPVDNPLYEVTETVTKELLRCPDNLTNETQIKPLYDFSKYPFYQLTAKEISVFTPTTCETLDMSIGSIISLPTPSSSSSSASGATRGGQGTKRTRDRHEPAIVSPVNNTTGVATSKRKLRF